MMPMAPPEDVAPPQPTAGPPAPESGEVRTMLIEVLKQANEVAQANGLDLLALVSEVQGSTAAAPPPPMMGGGETGGGPPMPF